MWSALRATFTVKPQPSGATQDPAGKTHYCLALPLPDEEDTALTANALKAMAHPLRWKILCALGENELSVGEIVDRTGTSQSNIPSTWSSCVTRTSWVAGKEANRIFYRIRNDQLLDLIGIMRDVLCPANLDDRYPRSHGAPLFRRLAADRRLGVLG